jgi:hypothetical protein
MRTATGTSAAKASTSKSASGVNGLRTNLVRSMEPKQQQPYAGNGCSAQEFIASICSRSRRLFSRFTVSMNTMPGFPCLKPHSVISSNSLRAEMRR